MTTIHHHPKIRQRYKLEQAVEANEHLRHWLCIYFWNTHRSAEWKD